MKYRHIQQVYGDILRVAKSPATKTDLMYGSFVSFEQLQRDLKGLLDAGLIELRDERYCTTPKGMQFVELSDQMNAMLNIKPTIITPRIR